jgi:hypothetical protein
MTTRILALFLLAAACKDDIHALDAPPAPIDSPSTDGSTTDGASSPSLAVVAAGDFVEGTTGLLSSVGTVSHSTTENIAPGSVGDNPVTRVDTTAGFVYVINSDDGDNVVQLDTATLTVQQQVSTGSGTNPQDVAVLGTVFYVATLANAGLEFEDTSLGSAAKFAFIDLSCKAGSATCKAGATIQAVPDCNSVIAVGSNIYVSCELLTNTGDDAPTGNGLIEVIDTGSNAVIANFNLQHPNPFGLFENLPDGNIAIPTIDFETGSGCLEEVNVTTNASAGCIVQNGQLGSGNYVNRMAVTADGKTLMLDVENESPGFGALLPYDLAGSALGSAISPTTEILGDVATCPDGNVVVSDVGSGSNGLRFYSKTAERTTGPLNVGIKPAASHGLVCY